MGKKQEEGETPEVQRETGRTADLIPNRKNPKLTLRRVNRREQKPRRGELENTIWK